MKEVQGYFEWLFGESLIYLSKEAWDKGNPYHEDVIKLSDAMEEFANKKIRILIEEIE